MLRRRALTVAPGAMQVSNPSMQPRKIPPTMMSVGGTTSAPPSPNNLLAQMAAITKQFHSKPLNVQDDLTLPTIEEHCAKKIDFDNAAEQLPVLNVVNSKIHLLSSHEMKNISVCDVVNDSGHGLNSTEDPRMGVLESKVRCATCSACICGGHYGMIPLRLPIYNPLYVKQLICVLTSVCGCCGKLLVTENIIKSKGIDRLSFDKKLAALKELCSGMHCTHASASRDTALTKAGESLGAGVVLRCGKNPVYSESVVMEEIRIMCSYEKGNKDAKIKQINDIFNILDAIPQKDARLMGFSKGSHPRNFIMRGIMVMPPISRPPVRDSGSVLPDQITTLYNKIIKANNKIDPSTPDMNSRHLADIYDNYKQIVNNPSKKKMGNRDLQCISSRLDSKKGLPRSGLMAKRVNFCARTVLSPDPELEIGQIRIPRIFANRLTTRVEVSAFNIDHLYQLLADGKITHVLKGSYQQEVLPGVKYTMNIGDKVFRHLEESDFILFNRNPSLHKYSMMAYRVIFGDQLTIGLHPSCCPPHNADFDGDEGGLWALQTCSSMAEAQELMYVQHHIISDQRASPTIGLIMCSITSAYLMTKDDVMVEPDVFRECADIILSKTQLSTLRARCEAQGVHPLSGKALFSMLLPEDFQYEKGKVRIVDGVLVEGRITSKQVGTSSRSIAQDILTFYGKDRACSFITDATWVMLHWIRHHGFSIGLKDCMDMRVVQTWDKNPETGEMEVVSKEVDYNTLLIRQHLELAKLKIRALGPEKEDPIQESRREMAVKEALNTVQAIGTEIVMNMFNAEDKNGRENAVGVMSDQGGGAKGKLFNIAQICGVVGQQHLSGQRLKRTLNQGRRCLPAYDDDIYDPATQGFIQHSFMEGLTPEELFFHHAGSREGIFATSLSVPETGSMNHRMFKCFEGLVVGSDHSIRNTNGTIFQFVYNDGFATNNKMAISHGGNTVNSFIDVKAVAKHLNSKHAPTHV